MFEDDPKTVPVEYDVTVDGAREGKRQRRPL